MKKQYNKMLRLFHQNSITLDWVKAQKQITTGLEYNRLVLIELDLVKDRIKLIAQIPIELLVTVSYQKTVAA